MQMLQTRYSLFFLFGARFNSRSIPHRMVVCNEIIRQWNLIAGILFWESFVHDTSHTLTATTFRSRSIEYDYVIMIDGSYDATMNIMGCGLYCWRRYENVFAAAGSFPGGDANF